VQAARVEGRAHVTRQALVHTAQLSKEEENHILAAPLCELRCKSIVDAYAVYAAYEVGQP
jgi:hypothetical protein